MSVLLIILFRRSVVEEMQSDGGYNTYCTSWGCHDGVWLDDVDNGWPSRIPGGCCGGGCSSAASCTGVVGTPNVSAQGRLRAPPLWHYTVPQSAQALAGTCGPAGCPPSQLLCAARTGWASPELTSSCGGRGTWGRPREGYVVAHAGDPRDRILVAAQEAAPRLSILVQTTAVARRPSSSALAKACAPHLSER